MEQENFIKCKNCEKEFRGYYILPNGLCAMCDKEEKITPVTPPKIKENNNFCAACGNKINQKDKFCKTCGNEITQRLAQIDKKEQSSTQTKEMTHRDLSMKWHNAYKNILLWGSIIYSLIFITIAAIDGQGFWIRIFCLIPAAIGILIFYGLDNHLIWGWYLIMINTLLIEIIIPVRAAMDGFLISVGTGIGMFCFGLLLASAWCIPNLIYFYKRKLYFKNWT